MIGWLQPAALWGLSLLAAPVLIHLLRTRLAPRVPFPSIRFVRASPAASVRVGRPSELVLLLLRTGIVACAAIAMAQPLFLSRSRMDEWDRRVARAIVVDSSASMRPDRDAADSPAVRAAATAAVEAQASDIDAALQIQANELRDGLRRAVAWLRTAVPARQEIVIISDFQLGTLTGRDMALVPAGTGIRFIPVGAPARARRLDDERLLGAPGVPERVLRSEISAEGTRTAFLEAGQPAGSGLRLVTAAGEAEEQRLLRAVARAGAPAPTSEEPLAICFAPATGPLAISAPAERWMVQTIVRLEADRELVTLARRVQALELERSDRWLPLVRDGQGRPLVRAASAEGELILDVAASPSSYFGAAVVRAALAARRGRLDRAEHEVLQIPAPALSAWARPAGPVESEAWRRAGFSDARWFWVAALGLLLGEQRLRSRRRPAREDDRVAA